MGVSLSSFHSLFFSVPPLPLICMTESWDANTKKKTAGQTNTGQQFPYIGQFSFAFAPVSERNTTCILPGNNGRLESGPCPTDGSQLFSIFP